MSDRRARKRPRGNDLTLDQVVRAAIELLDEHGIDAFSMRALAHRLGRGTMTAYGHVESREALIRLAADAVQTELPNVTDLPWYERLEAFARHGWATSWRVHPWVVDYIDSGGVSEQATQRLVAMEQVFREAGFAEDEILSALAAHWSFVIGTLRLILSAQGHTPAGEDALFDFNLRTWILGFAAVANGWLPVTVETLASEGGVEWSRRSRQAARATGR